MSEKKVTLNRAEVEATGLPYYFRREEVPEGLITKTQAKLIKKPISESTQPAAYFLSRMNKGYIPLYSCPGERLKDCNDIRWERMCGRFEDRDKSIQR